MDVNTAILYKKIRLFLIFFCALLSFSCKNGATSEPTIQVIYEDEKAIEVALGATPTSEDIHLFLKGTQDTPVLGDFKTVNDTSIVFTPVVPFTHGNSYEVFHNTKKIGEFSIDDLINSKKPTVMAIYPSTDMVPENLLKIYLVFSKPMQEVQNALDFIEVYNVTDATETTIFLELQNELWNADHTTLTLWLDPGRIKTDLIPNLTKGVPLKTGKHYTVSISSQWKDAENTTLDSTYVKHLYVGPRDASKIKLENWIIKTPNQGTSDELIIVTNEPLDAMLALETLRIKDAQHNMINGIFKLAQKEKQVVFIPSKSWKSGTYKVSVLSILEDLAGNNLNHLFDKDLLLHIDANDKEQYTVDFTVD